MELEKCPMVNGETEVVVVGFPDPFRDAVRDLDHHCALKDSLAVMDKHLEELNLDRKGRLGYQFSVLFVDEEKNYRLVYSYNGNGEIHISKGFEGAVIFGDGQTRLLPREEWLPYPGGRLVIRTIDEGAQRNDG